MGSMRTVVGTIEWLLLDDDIVDKKMHDDDDVSDNVDRTWEVMAFSEETCDVATSEYRRSTLSDVGRTSVGACSDNEFLAMNAANGLGCEHAATQIFIITLYVGMVLLKNKFKKKL